MGIKGNLLVGLLVLVGSIFTGGRAWEQRYSTASFNRTSFPHDFLFGTASAAYQNEGAAFEGGRGLSIWDTFTHKYPEKITDGGNGDIAVDSYHRYKEDVQIIKRMGLEAYRFSIAWPRVLPRGKLRGGVNEEGIKYYNNLINDLISNGIEPVVTIFHWDLPQVLEDEYGGFRSPKIVDDYVDFAELCFKRFGDRVKYWITLNEPWSFSTGGYVTGIFAPGRCSSWMEANCTGGDSSSEPYIVTHNMLIAHAVAVKLYRQKYQALQKGQIGITLVTRWMVPFSDATHNRRAAERALDFRFGWYMEPLTTGTYPRSMRSLVGKRLPRFSREESKLINGSYDFLGLNYYTSIYAAYAPASNNLNLSYNTDSRVHLHTDRNGVPIGEQAGSPWLYVYPRGILDLLLYIKRKYNDPIIYITENGIDEAENATLTLKEALNDTVRIDYYYHHLNFVLCAIRDGVKVRGFFAWTLVDNFEWAEGYTVRFGINYVDFKNRLKRYPKLSAQWLQKFLLK